MQQSQAGATPAGGPGIVARRSIHYFTGYSRQLRVAIFPGQPPVRWGQSNTVDCSAHIVPGGTVGCTNPAATVVMRPTGVQILLCAPADPAPTTLAGVMKTATLTQYLRTRTNLSEGGHGCVNARHQRCGFPTCRWEQYFIVRSR